MNRTIAPCTKEVIASNAGSVRRRRDKMRFGVGVAIVMGGLLSSNLFALAPPRG